MTPRDGDGRRPSILVVDDHADAADTLAALLRRAGYRAIVARSVPAALAAAAADRLAAVVLELRLGRPDGWELARRLRAGGCRARLVAVTTCGQPDDWRRSGEAGIDRHLVKPVDPPELLAALAGDAGAGVTLATAGGPPHRRAAPT